MKFTTLLTSVLACAASVFAQGTIDQPVAWTSIMPNSVFNFSYSINADYCKSSYGFSVYIITETPTNMDPAQQWMNGYYLGHYDAENYPAVPYPTNPAPPNFTMPNFANSQGGFGAGKNASNATFNVMVMEEWDDCSGSLGRKIGLTMTPIVYNATEGYQ
ncbi:uncharacterized protein B0H18DRAFT_950544 [Fomitopsis serialis]|uniref:uncharacterized protein n=1 Tax=Fomitopsis serialis TaxID=139415 RepID=UPI00200883A1|nr:uncharacterized protein B0H18DRAFT_950544 [Neoantrodia serialis]KAH9936161.1 hypothetical protein B0H18DRAFT_950544 [Neoantrodia serialis]